MAAPPRIQGHTLRARCASLEKALEHEKEARAKLVKSNRVYAQREFNKKRVFKKYIDCVRELRLASTQPAGLVKRLAELELKLL